MKRLSRWLGALLKPAEDPRSTADAATSSQRLVAELRRSREEIGQLRRQFEARAETLSEPHRERVSQQARELAEQEHELLLAEHDLTLAAEERRAQRALAAARYRAIEAQVRADE